MKNKILKSLFLIIICCLPLYLVKVNTFGVPSNIFEILATLVIVLTFIYVRSFVFKKITSLPKIVLLALAFIVSGLLFSTFLNNDYRTGLGIIKGWFLIPMLFAFSLYAIIDSREDVEKIIKSIYFSIVFVGFIALIYKILGAATYDNRLTAFYSSPNYLAMYLAPGVFFGIYFLSNSFLKNNFSKTFFFYGATMLFILVPLYYTYSYGAWLALIASFTITTLALKKTCSKMHWVILFLIIGALVLFFSQISTQKFSAITHLSSRSSIASRLMIWKASTLLIKNNPLIGIGPGNFQAAYLAIQPEFEPYLEWAVPQPHNLLLAFWLQAGLLGLLGFSGLLFFVFNSLKDLFRHKKNAALATPLFGFFLYTILHGLIDTPYWKNDLAALFWLCFFLILAIKRLFKDSSYN